MNKIERKAWINGTDRCERQGNEGDWMKEGEELAKEHICMTHRHR